MAKTYSACPGQLTTFMVVGTDDIKPGTLCYYDREIDQYRPVHPSGGSWHRDQNGNVLKDNVAIVTILSEYVEKKAE